MKKLVFLFTIISCGNCAKILGVFPTPAPSRYILGSTLMKALAERGHDVTIISSFSEKTPPKNGTYRDITLTGLPEYMREKLMSDGTNMFDREGMNPFLMSVFLGYKLAEIMNKALEHENVQKLIHSDEKFDAVIVEQFMNDAHKALATHFGAPLIVLNTVGANFWTNPLVGNPAPPSFISNTLAGYSVPMSFWNRVSNTLLTLFNDLFYKLYFYPKQNEVIKKYIPNGPDINDVLYNISLVLVNSHPSLNQPVPFVPNMIEIGGFHVKPPKKLPQDLQEYLDNAKEGVIYFSMGSNLKSAHLPPEKRDEILKAFSKLKEKVLWKWENDNLPGQPPNVKTAKWLPQQDILGHPNVKLFITHGGFSSTIETVYHGVPILAIPIYGDQKLNARTAVEHGYGVVLPYKEISEENLTKSIKTILNNPSFKKNVEKRSKLFHDRLVSPMDTAIYWVEYVIRHKGAPHLRVAGVDLPWYQYHLVDVFAFLAVVVMLVVFISCSCINLICKGRSTKLKMT